MAWVGVVPSPCPISSRSPLSLGVVISWAPLQICRDFVVKGIRCLASALSQCLTALVAPNNPSCFPHALSHQQSEHKDMPGDVLVTTFNMLSFSGERSKRSEEVMEHVKSIEWGLVLLDEVCGRAPPSAAGLWTQGCAVFVERCHDGIK